MGRLTRMVMVGAIVGTVGLLGVPGLVSADPKLMAAAKAAGLPAQNCQYCHTVALPKKETFKPEDLNERGKYLVDEQKKQNAKDIDISWLKNYTGK
jgi:hypothetical protein